METLDFAGKTAIRVRELHPEVERLEIPSGVTAFWGLNRFPNLRTVFYDGAADVFGWGESLEWLGEKAGDDDAFLQRLFTDVLGAPPIAPSLLAITAPHMTPIQALPGYWPLLRSMDELVSRCNTRQDSSRQNGILSRSYAQLRRLAYAMELGRAAAGGDWPGYPEAERFSPEEQLVYALALVEGHSYQAFYTGEGPFGYCHTRSKKTYLPFLRQLITLEDTEQFRRQLEQLMDWGVLTEQNLSAALEWTLRHGLTETTAFLLARRKKPAGLEEEFAL